MITKTYQGSPCRKYGHTERYVSNGTCVSCDKARQKKDEHKEEKAIYNKKWNAENPEKRLASVKKYNAKNKEKILAKAKKKYAENKEERLAQVKKYQAENKEKIWAQKKIYRLKNLKLYAYYAALRRARLKQQTPPWADLELIKEIYLSCPDGYDVDHIHPLSKGGLHIHYNLRAIPMIENRRKYNKIL